MTLVWPFIPQMDVVESLEWRTDVIKTKRAEYRHNLRPIPRVRYHFRHILDDADYGAARELARAVGCGNVLVPDWTVGTQIPTVSVGTVTLPVDTTHATAYRQGGSALVWVSNMSYEVVEVQAIGVGTITVSALVATRVAPWVLPLRLAWFDAEFSGERGPHFYTEADAVFLSVDTEDLSAASGGLSFPTYLGAPVVTDPIEMINGATEQNQRESEVVDPGIGALYKYPVFATPNQAASLAWTVQSASDLWALRVWLHTRKGRWKQFWSSSWNADVTVTKDIVPGDGSIQVADIDFATKYPLPTDLAVVGTDGTFVCLRITSVSAGPSGHELLNFQGAFSGTTWALADIAKTCKLTLSRLDSDRVEIQHLPGRQATVVVATKEVPVYP